LNFPLNQNKWVVLLKPAEHSVNNSKYERISVDDVCESDVMAVVICDPVMSSVCCVESSEGADVIMGVLVESEFFVIDVVVSISPVVAIDDVVVRILATTTKINFKRFIELQASYSVTMYAQ
jgi:hypothetical protein